MGREFGSFRAFYPFYLGEHSNRTCRRLHFIGTTASLFIALAAVLRDEYGLLLVAVVTGYAFAWVGHFFFEKNRPATFTHPFYSLMGDWVMWKDIVAGKIKF